jgi:hypothetical protein
VSVPKGKPPKGEARDHLGARDYRRRRRVRAFPKQRQLARSGLDLSCIYPDLNEWLRVGYTVGQPEYQGLGTPGKHPHLIG